MSVEQAAKLERAEVLRLAGSPATRDRVQAAESIISFSDPEALTVLGRLLLDSENTSPVESAAKAVGEQGNADQVSVLLSAYALGPGQTDWTLGGGLNHAVFWREFDVGQLAAERPGWLVLAEGAAEFKRWAHIDQTTPAKPAEFSLGWAVGQERAGVPGARRALAVLADQPGRPFSPQVSLLYARILLGVEQYSGSEREEGDELARTCCEVLLGTDQVDALEVLLAACSVARRPRQALIMEQLRSAGSRIDKARLGQLAQAPDPWVSTTARLLEEAPGDP